MAINPLRKNLENTQFARVATPLGNRTPGNPGFAADFGIEPLADEDGRLIVRIAGRKGYLDDTQHFNSAAFVELQAFGVNPEEIWLFQITGFSVSPAIRFLQLFENYAGAPPVLGNIPIFSSIVPPGSNFSFEPKAPWLLNGLTIVSSLTGDTYTPSGTSDFWINSELNVY